MADIAFGVIGLVQFSLTTGKSLSQLIDSFANQNRVIRDLRDDVASLRGVLDDLLETLGPNPETAEKLSSIKLPLNSCGQICQEFEALIRKCTAHTTGDARSVRDWSKLRLKSQEITDFRVTLSGYKSSIQIALGIYNLRSSRVTQECLDGYQKMIEETRVDLSEQLTRIESQRLRDDDAPPPTAAYMEWVTSQQRLQQERASTAKCIEMMDELSVDIDRRQRTLIQDISVASEDSEHASSGAASPFFPSSAFAASRLREARERIASTRRELGTRFHAMGGQGEDPSPPHENSLRGCLSLCDEALNEAKQMRVSNYEDVKLDEDSRNYIVSTTEDLISAKRITTGPRSVMVMGQLSDQSLQVSFQSFATAPTANTTPPPSDTAPNASFDRYGVGHRVPGHAQTA